MGAGEVKNSITITGRTVGAIAVGDGAQASGSLGGAPRPGGTFALDFKAKGATREQIALWLRGVASVLEDPEHPTTTFAKEENGTSRAWTLTREPAE